MPAATSTVLPHPMTPLQLRAYRDPWGNAMGKQPPIDILPSGERVGLSLNK